VFYFTDGENYDTDNAEFIETLRKEFPDNLVNFVGITQIYAYDYRNSVLENVKKAKQADVLGENVRLAEIPGTQDNMGDARNEAVLKAIKDLLGKTKVS
jgi:uncharacterized sporulation protein YeaH/YhbH (DUF444 family)